MLGGGEREGRQSSDSHFHDHTSFIIYSLHCLNNEAFANNSMRILSLSLCLWFASGFQVAPPSSISSTTLKAPRAVVPPPSSVLTNKPTAVSSLSATTVEEDVTAAATIGTIDENIYRFNKLLIDSVYKLVCFLYPVRGTDRDYARFFVLETVARVPYFAYLTVLHFRESKKM